MTDSIRLEEARTAAKIQIESMREAVRKTVRLLLGRERKPGTRIYSKCCNGGRIFVEAPHDTPPLIKSFFLGENPRWKHILDSQVIRLNNAISLAAIQYTSVRFSGPGVPTIVVNGRINDSASPLRFRNETTGTRQ